jgi:hypothetical protein
MRKQTVNKLVDEFFTTYQARVKMRKEKGYRKSEAYQKLVAACDRIHAELAKNGSVEGNGFFVHVSEYKRNKKKRVRVQIHSDKFLGKAA